MNDFVESAVFKSIQWMLPLIIREEKLARLVSDNTEFDSKAKAAFSEWSQSMRRNYAQIKYQGDNVYELPELEMLRIETCSCLIHEHWQAALSLTNILLETSLKLFLIYSSVAVSRGAAESTTPRNLLIDLQAPVQKYMRMELHNTINSACKKGLIGKKTKDELHTYRERFRNAFFHADMQSMFGDQTTHITELDLSKEEINERKEIPIRSMPLLLGEALWINAREYALLYFKSVDAMIRETLPKVFPNMRQEQSDNPDDPK